MTIPMLSDKEIIQALIDRNDWVTGQFFFKDCRPLFVSIIRKIFACDADYDEFVNDLYLHLMDNDAYRLRQFEGRSSVYQWMKIVAIRYFTAKKLRMIENNSKEALWEMDDNRETEENAKRVAAHVDTDTLISNVENKRHRYVIRRLVLEDAEPIKVAQELRVTVDNLYNIKKRAMDALIKIAINDAM